MKKDKFEGYCTSSKLYYEQWKEAVKFAYLDLFMNFKDKPNKKLILGIINTAY